MDISGIRKRSGENVAKGREEGIMTRETTRHEKREVRKIKPWNLGESGMMCIRINSSWEQSHVYFGWMDATRKHCSLCCSVGALPAVAGHNADD